MLLPFFMQPKGLVLRYGYFKYIWQQNANPPNSDSLYPTNRNKQPYSDRKKEHNINPVSTLHPACKSVKVLLKRMGAGQIGEILRGIFAHKGAKRGKWLSKGMTGLTPALRSD